MSNKNVLTETEYEQISFEFESFTENKVRRGKLVTMHDFEMFAQSNEYNLNKVYCANPWVDSKLTVEVIERIEKANEEIKIDF